MAEAENGTETEEFEILHTPAFGKQVGETIDLEPAVAEAFDDNLRPADADADEEQVRSQVVGANRGPTTLADVNGPYEPGEYTVATDPINGVQPGETFEGKSESVVRAFADNLIDPESDEDDSGESTDDSESSGSDEPDDSGSGSSESDDFEAEGESTTYDTPEEMLDQNVTPVQETIDAAGLNDEQLEKLRAAEVDGEDRDGVTGYIDDLLEN